MSKSLKLFAAIGLILASTSLAQAQDADAGAKVFKKCKACHAVGDGARNRVGPHLNSVFGRKAASIEGFKYSKAMSVAGSGGLVWNDETLAAFLTKPRKMMKGTKMAFSGLKKEKDRANLLAFLKSFSPDAASAAAPETPKKQEIAAAPAPTEPKAKPVAAKDAPIPEHGVFHLGRAALVEEVKAWDIDIRPDGQGLPTGRGTVAQGEPIYTENCAVCHGDFGEGTGRWPILAGGQNTLTDERPEKTIGSYWPYLSTVYDYIRRAMPFGDARSLSDDDVYAVTAYLLFLNDIVTDEEFELSNENFNNTRLPNEANFFADNRKEEPQNTARSEPCMTDCKPGKAEVTMRARVLDVTPDSKEGEGAGAIE